MKYIMSLLLSLSSLLLLQAQIPSYRPHVPPPTHNPIPTQYPFRHHNVGANLNLSGTTFNGWVVTVSGDTLHGKIKSRGEVENQTRVRFFEQPKQKVVFTPADLNGYALEIDGRTYEYVLFSHNSTSIFIIKLIDGPVKLYARYYQNFQGAALPYYYTQRGNGPIAEFGTFSAGIGSDNFKEEASIFFSDCPELVQKIDSKKYKLKDIRTAFAEYNEWLLKKGGKKENAEDYYIEGQY